MKYLIIILFFFLRHSPNVVVTYYISNAGNGTNNGTTTGTPWDLAKLNSSWASINAGDFILFNRGETIYGEIIVGKDGTLANKITLGAYGTGANPILTGLTTITGFTAVPGHANVYTSNAAVSTVTTLNVVVVNDVIQEKGRWPDHNSPNGGWAIVDAGSSTTTVKDAALPSTPVWTGAHIVIRTDAWANDSGTVTAHNTSTDVLTFTPAAGSSVSTNEGYFITDDPDLDHLTKHGEWYYNPTAKTLSIYTTTNPSNYTIQVATKENVITATDDDYVVIRDVEIKGANSYGIQRAVNGGTNSTGTYLYNATIHDIGITGLYCHNNTNTLVDIDNCLFQDILDVGCDFVGTSNNNRTIQRTSFINIGMFPGMSNYSSLHAIPIYTSGGDGLTIHDCYFNGAGYVSIRQNSNNVLIDSNRITNYCTEYDDGGGIYSGFATYTTNRKYLHNMIWDAPGAPLGSAGTTAKASGIYPDQRNQNIEIGYNSIWNMGKSGVYVHDAQDMNIHDNWMYNCPTAALEIVQDPGSGSAPFGVVQGTYSRNNVMIAKGQQYIMRDWTSNTSDSSFTANVNNIDSNYYIRPIETNDDIIYSIEFYLSVGGTERRFFRNLTEFKAVHGWENDSHGSPITYASTVDPDTVFLFLPNHGKTDSTVVLSQSYRDVQGTIHYSGESYVIPGRQVRMLFESTDIPPSPPLPKIYTNNNGKLYFKGNKILIQL